MVVVGSFSSFCLKMNFWLPVYVNVLEKKIAKFAKCALPELQILEVVFIVLKIGESAKRGVLLQNAE